MGKFDEWLDAVSDSFFAKHRKIAAATDTKKQIVAALNAKPTLPMLKAYYNALQPEMKNDPDVLQAYNMRLIDPVVVSESGKSEIEKLIDSAETGFSELGTIIAKKYMSIKGATPETALASATNLVALDYSADIAVGLASLTAEAVGFGQIEKLDSFYHFFKSKTGYQGPITMLMKAPIELGVISPLSKYLHSQYRDEYLSGQVALMLATKGHITEEQMRKAYQYEGYPEWAIDAFVKDRWRELRLGEIAWALNDALIDEKWLDLKLQNALYAPEDRPIIIRMIQEKYLRSYRDRVATQLRNLYKEGYVTYADFSDGLKQLGIPDKVRNMLASEAQYLYRQDLNADLRATWLAAYKNDIINENVYRGNLGTIIKDPARVEAEINKAKAARKPEAVAPPKPQTQGIKISSKPSNAMILLDDVDTGRLTPDTIETTAAAHTLTVSAEGYEDAVYQVTVEAGQFVEIYAVLVPLLEAAE